MHVRMVTNPDPWPISLRVAVESRVNAGAHCVLPLAWERCQGWPENARFYITDSADIAVLLDNWERGGAEAVDWLLRIMQ